MTDPVTDDAIRAEILAMAVGRGRESSLCPSEVARALTDDWRPLMPRIRALAAGMEGIVATQGGAVVDAASARGPIRLRLR